MKIIKAFTTSIQGAYYYEDIRALEKHSIPESERWESRAITPGFQRVREIAEGVSIGLKLEDGQVIWGDCVASLFRPDSATAVIANEVLPWIQDASLVSWRESLSGTNPHWHPAIRYGLSQALLRAVAYLKRKTMAEIICDEWNLPIPSGPISVQGSCGNDRYDNVDKMIVNHLEALPHWQVDDIASTIGAHGEVLISYASWLKARIRKLGRDNYHPTLHFDVHGSLGKIFNSDQGLIANYLGLLRNTVYPFSVRVENPVIQACLADQLEMMASLKDVCIRKGVDVSIVADEWANTLPAIQAFIQAKAADMIHLKMPKLGSVSESIDAVLSCQKQGVKALLGGSSVETENSTQASVHVALATRPEAILAKPGMGVNEAIMLVRNEMKRTLSCF